MQEMAGLDVVTDGEWRRRSYIGVIAELAHGFTLEVNPADGRPWTVVTDKLAPKPAGFIASEAKFLKSVARVGTKITLPAPALLGERLWNAERSKKAYLIHLFQDMIEQGVEFGHVDTHGQYREIDTQEDLDLAQKEWRL